MDGADLTRRLTQLTNEGSGTWLDPRSTYDYLNEAAVEFADRTGCLRSTQSIITIADTQEYNINADFLRLYLRNADDDYVLKYNNGTATTTLRWKEYNEISLDTSTNTVSTPTHFSIIDADLPDQVSGTATSAGATTGGVSTLADTAGDFSDVEAGDTVHNTTDGSSGVVTSKTSSTALQTALFGGTADDWSSSDSYIIQPQGRCKLVLGQIPSTAGHTITLQYIQRPAPVYGDYLSFRFSKDVGEALVNYAAWKYKYRGSEPSFGNAFYQFWEARVRRHAMTVNKGIRPDFIRVSFKNDHR